MVYPDPKHLQGAVAQRQRPVRRCRVSHTIDALTALPRAPPHPPRLLQKLPSAEQQQDAAGEPDEYAVERKVVETPLVAYLMKKRSDAREARMAVRRELG